MKKHLEIKEIEHKGIKVLVKVDYDAGTASLVERDPSGTGYCPKKWVFAHRGLDYTNGWLTILEAMTVAVKECKKDLEHKLAEDSAFKNNIIVEAFGEVEYKIKKRKSKKK